MFLRDAGNANLNCNNMGFLKASLVTFNDEIIQNIQVGATSALMESSRVPEGKGNTAVNKVFRVVDNEHIQRLLVQSVESPLPSAKQLGRKTLVEMRKWLMMLLIKSSVLPDTLWLAMV